MTERGFTAAEYGILRGSQLFSGFSQEDFSYALDFFGARAARYEKGEFLHRVGSRLSRFGLVLSGRVQVHMDDFEGNLLIMANVTPGKTFGESLCFLEREEEPVTISAAEDTRVAWLGTEAVRRFSKDVRDHELRLRFITLVTGRALAMNDRIQILSGQPVQAVRDPLGFQTGFFGIVHVPEIAASAQLGHGALPVPAMRGFFQDLHNFAGSPGFLGLFNPQAHPFPSNGVGDKHRTAFNVGNPLTLGGIVGDEGFVNLVFDEHGFLRLTGCTPFRFSGASAHTFRRISGRFHCRTTHSM